MGDSRRGLIKRMELTIEKLLSSKEEQRKSMQGHIDKLETIISGLMAEQDKEKWK